ncbi:DNA-binding protein [Streptomyces sp. NPDC097640]|uniref:NACHT and WD repeat domain-containing protein n=1 Tax=Streptomyces sp. NPDC097640 TaxID=3157229 RepID=UPI0033171487
MGRRESPLDPSAGPVQRFAYELRKLRSEAGGPTYRAMAHRVPYSITTLSRAAAGEQLPSLPVTLAYVEACGGDAADRAAWEARWREAAEEATGLPREDDDATPPYRGLARFEPGDHERFFGRDQLVADLLELVGESRFAAVFGPSGSGKSSLLRAGLIPALRDGAAEPLPRPSVIRVLTPGDRPLRTHADALGPKGGDGDTWLVVDQFEEVFTLCQDPAERAGFIERLLSARDEGSRLRVVIGVRADFFGRCAEHRELTAALRGATLLVGPMGRAELREAIVKPAAADGLIVERALTARVVEEVVDEPGGLPLMSHALLETWRRRRSRALTVESYEAAGGVHGAIALTAERVYGELSEEQAEAARRIMLRLITPGEGAQDTRRPVDREELGLGPGTPPDAPSGTPPGTPPGSDSGPGSGSDSGSGDTALVLERLVRARLVTLDEGTVDLAHEALITAWPRLRGWIDEDRQRLRIHRRLTEAARTWEELGREPGALYRGARLAEAWEAFGEPGGSAELTAVERDFLSAGRAAGTRERRRVRTFVGSVAVLVVLALVAGVVAWQQNRTGEQRRAEAVSRRISSVAQNMRRADPVTALRLSAAAWNVSHTVEARSALLGAMAQRERDTFTTTGGDATDFGLLSADGRTLVTSGADGQVFGWDLATHRRTSSFKTSDELETTSAVSPDGRQVVTDAETGLQLRDRVSGKPIGPRIQSVARDVYFGASGRTLLIEDEQWLRLWDIRHRRVLLRRPSESAQQPTLSADDRRLAECSDQNELEVWDVRAHRRIRTLPSTVSRLVCAPAEETDGSELLLTPDGTRLLISTAKGVRGWELASGRELPGITHAGLQHLTFSGDGRLLAATDDEEILVWRVDSPARPVYRYPLAGRRIAGLRLDADRGVIRYQEGDGMAGNAVRTLHLGGAMSSGWGPKRDGEVLFAPGAIRIAEVRKSGERERIELRRTGGGTSAAAALPSADCRTTGHPGGKGQYCVPLMAFSADGQTFAYGFGRRDAAADRHGVERVTLWDVREGRRTADLVLTPKGKDEPAVNSIALTPDGRTLIAYRRFSETLELWGIRSRTKVTRRANGLADVISGGFGNGGFGDFTVAFPDSSALAVRPDGRLVTTASGERFTLPSGRPLQSNRSQDPVYALVYSPDGEQLALGTDSGQVTLWDGDATRRLGAVAGTLTGEGRETAESVVALAYSPDGKVLAVAGENGTVRLWDAASSRPLGSALLTAGDGVRALSFSEDGRTLLVAGEHVPLQKFAVDPDRVTAAVCERAGGGLSRADWKTYIPEVPYREVC